MDVNLDLKAELIKRFGSQVEAAKRLGFREAKLSYIVRGHAQPSDREREAFEHVLGRELVRKLFKNNSIEEEK